MHPSSMLTPGQEGFEYYVYIMYLPQALHSAAGLYVYYFPPVMIMHSTTICINIEGYPDTPTRTFEF